MIIGSDWQAYTWKNKLSEQRDRILQCLEEILREADTEHNPLHMIERSVGIAALCMRRLLECRLVIDRFRDSQLEVHCVRRKAGSPWRETYISKTAGEIFQNYDLTDRVRNSGSPKSIANKILHARVVAVIVDSHYLPDGLLIASDTQRKEHIFHFTPMEFSDLLKKFLDDFVRRQIDGFAADDSNACTDKVFAKRD